MDEIRLLQELRAGLPPIRAEARHAARSSLSLRFEAAEQPVQGPRATRWRDRRLRFALAAAAPAGFALAPSIVDLGGRSDVQPASAAQALREVSGVAAGRRPEPA